MDEISDTWFHTIRSLSTTQDLIIMAELFEKQASLLREQALKIQAKQKSADESQALIDYLKQTPHTVIKQLKKGLSLKEAIVESAKLSNCPTETIDHYWKRFCRSKQDNDIKSRNNIIFILAAMGLSNNEISNRVNMHPGSISRLLGQEKRARIPLARRLEIFSQTIKS